MILANLLSANRRNLTILTVSETFNDNVLAKCSN